MAAGEREAGWLSAVFSTSIIPRRETHMRDLESQKQVTDIIWLSSSEAVDHVPNVPRGTRTRGHIRATHLAEPSAYTATLRVGAQPNDEHPKPHRPPCAPYNRRVRRSYYSPCVMNTTRC
ncbi:hypothetical protein K466DRAFT_229051 [Polyporus arcularius HHB13444]|uniref:Uncharacterized protein n=1 Tax=Polyporus arcularius HHB13444 TaxID=1314778 RepID=A0A5C3P3V0_9APHY|nr:hypothetical protein K466DRAFT_229051 [Polyporus arcularius HHB13444]